MYEGGLHEADQALGRLDSSRGGELDFGFVSTVVTCGWKVQMTLPALSSGALGILPHPSALHTGQGRLQRSGRGRGEAKAADFLSLRK